MTALYIILGVILALFILYILALRCRRGHKTLADLQGWSYAHRGLHGNGVPETPWKPSVWHWKTAMASSWMCI